MSRLGRNYLQVGFYTEMLFPQKGVRFIAVNDNVDSACGGNNDFTPLRNPQRMAGEDTSKKIIPKTAKGMSGKFTSKPVYGYLMDEDENYIVDEETAPVVRQIYQLCLAGNGPTKIARMLTEQQIPTPGTLEYRRTGSTRRYHPGYECKWATNTVVHILKTGSTPAVWCFKKENTSYKAAQGKEAGEAGFWRTTMSRLLTANMGRVQEQRKPANAPAMMKSGCFRYAFCAECAMCCTSRYQNKTRSRLYICGSYKKRSRDCTRTLSAPFDRRCPLQSPASAEDAALHGR